MTEVKRHLSMLQRRTKHASSCNFNLNIHSDLHALRDFRFRVNEIGKVNKLMHCEIYIAREATDIVLILFFPALSYAKERKQQEKPFSRVKYKSAVVFGYRSRQHRV